MTTPERIQRKRTKGWKMPPNTVYVGRPSKWGNPFMPHQKYPIVEVCSGLEIGERTIKDAAEAVAAFRDWHEEHSIPEDFDELRGKNLACWCPLYDEHGNRVPCHADVLLELANK